MKKLTKNDVVAMIKNLNSVIEYSSEENCYDKIVEFAKITSELQDHAKDLESLLPPIKGKRFLKWKTKKRKHSEEKRGQAEKQFNEFMFWINMTGRSHHPYGYNRTKPGETITKDKIFFNDICYNKYYSIEELEKDYHDPSILDRSRRYIIGFIECYENKFKADWLY